MKTTVEELPENKVRLEVEVPDHDVQHALEHAASDLAESVKIPGFRKGKVPLPVLIKRVGRDAVWQEAVRGHIEGWFWSAAASSGIRAVGNPQLDIPDMPGDGETFRFSATVPVMPKPEVADWTTLEVGAAEPEIPAELVDAEIDELRGAVAELAPVEGRPARVGDTVVVDLVFDPENVQRDYVVEIGDDRLVDEIQDALPGTAAGETRTVEFEVADGSRSSVEVTVKEIKEKLLPEADDELAKAASEFETLAELRADIESRLREQLDAELELRFREDAVDALVAASTIEGADLLVEARTRDLVGGLVRSLERRGIEIGTYLAATGQTEEQILGRLRAEADQAVRRELVLDAVAEKLALEISDEEVVSLVREQAEEADDDPETVIAQLREGGAWESVRADLRLRRALDEVVRGVKRIPLDLARAREKLWTPEKEKGGQKMNIWTPGSEEGR